MSEIIKLNIAYSYPVHWGSTKIFRDYIQNFYDAVGYKRFSDEFLYEYSNETLIMRIKNVFSKEWLYYFGASSKREQKGTYAGQFGEGFKIASLAAHRDFGWDIIMESDDWHINVTTADSVIADRKFKFLAYELDERPKDYSTVLMIKGVKEKEFKNFKYALNGFEYENNSLFGDRIFESNNISIYHLAKNNGYCKGGSIYINYQERAALNIPIIICNRNYSYDKEDDRDRGYLSEKEKNEFLNATINEDNIPDEISYELLLMLKKFWNLIGTNKCGVWNDTIKRLIRIVSCNKMTNNLFISDYGEKLVAQASTFTTAHNRKIAKEWFKNSQYHSKRKFVSFEFTSLGIKSYVQLCKENNGFEVYREANDKEKEYIKILSDAAMEMFRDVLCYEKLPQCDIITNKEAPVHAQAKIKGKYLNNINKSSPFKPVNNIDKIYLQQTELEGTNFGHAFATYMHELFHQFGGDRSLQFHQALLLLNLRILESYKVISKYDKRWRDVSC
jgi:hypothetical protein